jgi:hypothetical protein
MKSRTLQWLAIIFIFQAGVLHWADAQTQYQKVPYLGYLAMAAFLGALGASFLIYFRQRIGWLLGLLVAGGSIIGYVLIRTVELPGLAIEPWLYPYGVAETAANSLYILIFMFARPWERSQPVDEKPASSRLSYLLPFIGLLFITGATYGTYRWDIFAFQIGYHQHVGSYSAVCSTPITSLDELEQKYGVQVSLVGISAMGSIVDVRLMVTDPEKAQAFLENQGAILVNEEVLILAPHVHSHWRLKKGKVFVAFFSTQNGTVKPGSEVSLVYGKVRVEPIAVR